eukprot:5200878-Pleurochrysis_carterae.AAC.5
MQLCVRRPPVDLYYALPLVEYGLRVYLLQAAAGPEAAGVWLRSAFAFGYADQSACTHHSRRLSSAGFAVLVATGYELAACFSR